MQALLMHYDGRLDRSGKRWAMWQLLARAFNLELMIYTMGEELPKKPAVKLIALSIEHAQMKVSDEDVEWVFLVAPTRGRPLPRKHELIELRAFEHPASAIYVLGPDYANLQPDEYRADHYVRVEAPGGTGELHALTAASIVAYDRWRKLGEP
jgi:hypothetical protein